MVNNAVAAVARAAAGEMAPRHGPRLTAAVEAAIHADGGHQEQKTPGQYIDPIALGALIVAIAQFGYQVYTDRKDKGQQPTREAIAQAIRIERRKHSELTSEETEVIDIISAKVIEHGRDQLPGWPVNQRAGRPLHDSAAAGRFRRRWSRRQGPRSPVPPPLPRRLDLPVIRSALHAWAGPGTIGCRYRIA